MNAAAALLDLDRVRKLASAAHVAAIVAAVLLALMMLASVGLPALTLFADEGSVADRVVAALRMLIPSLPTVLMFTAMLKLRMALDHYSDGVFFDAKPARHIARAGADVAWALVTKAVVVPSLLTLSGETAGFRIDLEPVTLGAFAFALFVMVMGRILEAAAAIKAENDQIV